MNREEAVEYMVNESGMVEHDSIPNKTIRFKRDSGRFCLVGENFEINIEHLKNLPSDSFKAIGRLAPYRAVTGYMCGVDFAYELGEAVSGNTVYPSVGDLKKHHSSWEECGIDEVRVSFVKEIEPENY